MVLESSCVICKLSCSFNISLHLSDHEAHALEIRDSAAKLLTLLSVLYSFIEAALSYSYRHSRYTESTSIKCLHGILESLVERSNKISLWHSYIFKYNVRSWISIDSHLLLRCSKRYSVCVHVYDEHRDSTRTLLR